MHVRLSDLVEYCNELLQSSQINDYCPNGLQVESGESVKTLVSAVTASERAIDRAIELGADVLLVHHGYFWKGESAALVGMKGRRVAKLMRNNISLLAYHLPLDLHQTYGNNAQLGRVLGWEGCPASADGLIWMTHFDAPLKASDINNLISKNLSRETLWIEAGCEEVSRVAWCTGAAQSMLEQALALGADMFISGEISEPTVHIAREMGVHYVAAGHHATERGGAKSLGEHLADKFGLQHYFVDIDNPV